MKKIILSIIFLMSGICLFADRLTKTKTIEAENIIWQLDTLQSDSVIYIRPRPNCYGCWDYRAFSSKVWHSWFCSENNEPNLLSTPMTDSILLIDWFTEFPNQGIITSGYYLGFVVKPDNFGKVLYTFPDSSVGWIPVDSITNDTLFFSEFENKYKLRGDTIKKQKDSVYFIDRWIPVNGDTLRKIPWLDSVYFANTLLQNKDTIPDMRDTITINNVKLTNRDSITIQTYWGFKDSTGVYEDDGIYYMGDVAIGSYPSPFTGGKLTVSSTIETNSIYSISSYSGTYKYSGVFGQGVNGNNGVRGSASSNGVGVYGDSYAGYAGYFTGGRGVFINDSLKVGSGSTISRTGTMASYDKWTGTQAEWTANTPKNGVYPQASTTFWTIKD